ncbi:MAG TPA: hypothetical protein VG247_14970 [Pseudonocardiaceae bacterium]|jgi:hypothetical protein|nr:hypothetical protein [Pseudonocardiaceae bacterium]
MRRIVVPIVLAALLAVFGAVPASAYAPVDIVHTERVQAGPYAVTVGFSTWPIRAMRSLDFTFSPDGGIADKSGSLIMTGPEFGPRGSDSPLVRHPRKRDVWGLDVQALNTPGSYTIGFVINGPQGQGEGTLNNLTVLDQPGPPLPLSWAVGTLPLGALLVFLVIVWRRTRPGKRALIV